MSNVSPIPQPIDRELAALAEAVYDPRRTRVEINGAVWNRIESADPSAIPGSRGGRHTPHSGFKAAVFQREGSDHYVLAFAGTDGLDAPDWRTNIGQGLGLGAAQYRQAVNYAHAAKARYGNNLTHITGHSLGGGLATTASAVTGVPAVVYNPAGVHRNTLKSLGIDYKKFSKQAEAGQVRNYIVQGDPLNFANKIPLLTPPSLGAKTIIRDPARGGPVEKHQMSAMQRAMDATGLFRDASKAASNTATMGVDGPVQADAALSTDPRKRQMAMAKAFRENPALALEAYPELENAHKALSAVNVGAGPRRNRAVAMMQENLAKRIEHGNPIPTPRQARQMVVHAMGGYER